MIEEIKKSLPAGDPGAFPKETGPVSGEGGDVFTRLEHYRPNMSKGQRSIYTYLTAHYDEAVFLTAARLGEKAGVSESTVVRFASELGYSGYPEFLSSLQSFVKDRLSSIQRMDAAYRGRSRSEILNLVISADMKNLQDTLERLDSEAFEMAARLILEARNVYVAGLRSCAPLASFLAFYLGMIRGDIHLLSTTSTSELFEQMIHIGSSDCVIGISFPRYSMRVLKAMELARDRQAKVISMTDSSLSPMTLYSTVNLLARTDMVSIVDSLVAPLSLINALIVALTLKDPETVRLNLEEIEKTWNDYQVYLQDEIDFVNEEQMFKHPFGDRERE